MHYLVQLMVWVGCICVFCTRHQAGEKLHFWHLRALGFVCAECSLCSFFFSLALPGPSQFHLKSYLFVYLVFNEPSVYKYLVLLQRFRNNLVFLSTN
jgi:hypothetical protein